MIRKSAIIMAAGLACAAAQAQDPYKVILPLNADYNGAMAYIVNYDNGANVDSVLIEDGVATFQGKIDEPIAARLMIDGDRGPSFILENGTISFNKQYSAFGSPLNDRFQEIQDSLRTIASTYKEELPAPQKEAIEKKYSDYSKAAMAENIDNPIGYMMFLQEAYSMEPAELEAYLEKTPSLKSSQRISKLVEMNRRKAATGEGAKYTDFEVNGQKLSDFVGKDGKYLLVDFWASWCGPCRREIPVIKEILAANTDKLNVLGVAVWDKLPDTERAIGELGITWPVIKDAGTAPTDIYGISGIPCIMLIAPDGTIVSRDKQGDALKAAVTTALAK